MGCNASVQGRTLSPSKNPGMRVVTEEMVVSERRSVATTSSSDHHLGLWDDIPTDGFNHKALVRHSIFEVDEGAILAKANIHGDDKAIDEAWDGLQDEVVLQVKQAQRDSAASKGLTANSADLRGSFISFIGTTARVTAHDLYNLLNQGIINPFIQDEYFVLLIDTRPIDQFQAGHMTPAIHVSGFTSDLTLRGSAPSLTDYAFVIVYDEHGDDEGTAHSYRDTLSYDGTDNLAMLWGGYDAFRSMYPFMCSTKTFWGSYGRETITSYPAEIQHRNVYIGNRRHAADSAVIDGLGITHIVNVSVEHPNSFPEKVSYLNVRISDEKSSDLKSSFRIACEFIDGAIAVQGKVLIHCTMGVSRSCTIAVAWLMKAKRLSLTRALDFVKDKRPGVRPNWGFITQLGEWEIELFGKPLTDCDKVY